MTIFHHLNQYLQDVLMVWFGIFGYLEQERCHVSDNWLVPLHGKDNKQSSTFTDILIIHNLFVKSGIINSSRYIK